MSVTYVSSFIRYSTGAKLNFVVLEILFMSVYLHLLCDLCVSA